MSTLARIFQEKRLEVEAARAVTPLADLKAMIWDAEAPRGFRTALETADRSPALIAEVKKASPSRGLIRPDFDAKSIAASYQAAGAHALSVLTDGPNFQGSLENLRIAKEATRLPCLRKDFVYDPYQIYEARAWGADAVLLILAHLEAHEALELHRLSDELGMDALVEVHNKLEADVAVAIGARMVGVNNRDLATFKTDLAISEAVLPLLPGNILKVSESALESLTDLKRVHAAGARAVLIGTSFCSSPDIESKVREVMGWTAG